ncbi:MAG TPA: efflux RND transporter periplasmic adaptor subunit, partial [Thermaerobacter sp.]
MRKWVVGLAILALIAAGTYGALARRDTAPPGDSGANAEAPVPVVQAPDTVVAEGEVVPARAATLSFPAGGVAAEVLVAEGDRVKEGQPLIWLAAGQLEAAVAQAEAELRRAQARLRELKSGARSQEIAMAEAAVAAAEARLAKLKKEKAPREDVRIAEAELRRARAELDLTRAGARPEAIAAAEADVAAATAALQRARAALAETELRAPFAGTVVTVDIRPGEYAGPGVAVLRLADLSSWQVETRDLTEIQVAQVREGQPVTVTLDALPGVELRGKVQ